MPIDTLKATRRLQEDDTFSSEQAERIAEILSDLDVASATKDDLDDLEGRITSHIDRLSEHIDEVEAHLGERIDEANSRINPLEERVATESDLKVMKSKVGAVGNRLEQKIEEAHRTTIRTLVSAVVAMGLFLVVEIPLAVYLMG